MSIGEKLRIVRKARGLTQAEIAHIVGITRAQYARYEQGTTPRPSTLYVMCERLGLDSKTLEDKRK